jgi:hypothetical protein
VLVSEKIQAKKQIPIGGKRNSHWWDKEFPLMGKIILIGEKNNSHW